jgi:2-polyprenyl-6-methoxyphenol hydroxylase-like FAD-dependent oxidoreductase
MRTEATDLIEDGGRVTGVRATTPDGSLEVRAELTIGCDGRHSTVRERAGLTVDDLGAPMDVLWFRFSKKPGDPDETMGRFDAGRILVMIDRGDYWQCAFVIRKGAIEETQRAGLPALRQTIVGLAPMFADRVDELKDWDQIKLLTVAVNRLRRWHQPGLLCIGDAAHAMSPVAGVGVNYAVQDAVALANAIVPSLRAGSAPAPVLAAVQRRRERPVQRMQRIQRLAHDRISRPLRGTSALPRGARGFLTLTQPMLRRLMARLIGRGFLPEHVGAHVLAEP